MLWLQFSFQTYSFKSDFCGKYFFLFCFSLKIYTRKSEPVFLPPWRFSGRIQQQDLSCSMCSSRIYKLTFLWAIPGVGLLWCCSHQRAGRHRTNTPRLNIFLAFSHFLKHVTFYKYLYDWYMLFTISINFLSGEYKPLNPANTTWCFILFQWKLLMLQFMSCSLAVTVLLSKLPVTI